MNKGPGKKKIKKHFVKEAVTTACTTALSSHVYFCAHLPDFFF